MIERKRVCDCGGRADGICRRLFLGEHYMWGGRRYKSLDFYLKEKFGEKLYKLALSGGMTCPNRDGRISYGGCIFCSGEGSGDFAAPFGLGMEKQIEYAKSLVGEKYKGSRYIAYFQSYTNTYADTGYLRELYMPVIMRDDIAVLDIATRPDCLEDDKIALIQELASIKPVWVELGLQTSNEKTAVLLNRGYRNEVYASAVQRLHKAGAEVITHIITGLPGESRRDMLGSAELAAECGTDGIKLQLLHILEGTRLAEMYRNGEFEALSEEEYIAVISDIISILPENIVLHRLTGDGDRQKLIAPRWSLDKRSVLNHINHELKVRNIIQGCKAGRQ